MWLKFYKKKKAFWFGQPLITVKFYNNKFLKSLQKSFSKMKKKTCIYIYMQVTEEMTQSETLFILMLLLPSLLITHSKEGVSFWVKTSRYWTVLDFRRSERQNRNRGTWKAVSEQHWHKSVQPLSLIRIWLSNYQEKGDLILRIILDYNTFFNNFFSWIWKQQLTETSPFKILI